MKIKKKMTEEKLLKKWNAYYRVNTWCLIFFVLLVLIPLYMYAIGVDLEGYLLLYLIAFFVPCILLLIFDSIYKKMTDSHNINLLFQITVEYYNKWTISKRMMYSNLLEACIQKSENIEGNKIKELSSYIRKKTYVINPEKIIDLYKKNSEIKDCVIDSELIDIKSNIIVKKRAEFIIKSAIEIMLILVLIVTIIFGYFDLNINIDKSKFDLTNTVICEMAAIMLLTIEIFSSKKKQD